MRPFRPFAAPLLLSLAAACGGPASPDDTAVDDTRDTHDTVASDDTATTGERPLLEAGDYYTADLPVYTQDDCGFLSFVLTPYYTPLAWTGETSFTLGDSWIAADCTVDDRGAVTCDPVTDSFPPYTRDTELVATGTSRIRASSTQTFQRTDTLSWTCEGINCDYVQYAYEIPSFPCTTQLTSEWTWANAPIDTGTTLAEVPVTLNLTDDDGSAVRGATVTLGDQTGTTDGAGGVTFSVAPNTAFEFEATKEGLLDLHAIGRSGSEGGSWGRQIRSIDEMDAVSSPFGVTHDPKKGNLIVAIFVDYQDVRYHAGGASLELDAPYDLAVVPDVTSPTWYREGNSTIPGQTGQVWFMNVTPGTVHLDLTPLADFPVCVQTLGGPVAADLDIPIYAGETTTVSFACTEE